MAGLPVKTENYYYGNTEASVLSIGTTSSTSYEHSKRTQLPFLSGMDMLLVWRRVEAFKNACLSPFPSQYEITTGHD